MIMFPQSFPPQTLGKRDTELIWSSLVPAWVKMRAPETQEACQSPQGRSYCQCPLWAIPMHLLSGFLQLLNYHHLFFKALWFQNMLSGTSPESISATHVASLRTTIPTSWSSSQVCPMAFWSSNRFLLHVCTFWYSTQKGSRGRRYVRSK